MLRSHVKREPTDVLRSPLTNAVLGYVTSVSNSEVILTARETGLCLETETNIWHCEVHQIMTNDYYLMYFAMPNS